MALDSDNIIEQLAQIESELGATGSVDGEVSSVSQIDSVMQTVIPVDISGNYEGVILPSDWTLRDDGYYYYKVLHTTHNLAKPFVNKFLVETEDGYDNAFYSYTVLANRDIRFRSHLAVKCAYNITGER